MRKLMLIFALVHASYTQSLLPYSPECSQTVKHGRYTLCYSEKHEQPKWVAYNLTVKNLLCKGKRHGNFLIDKKIETGSATPMDYYRSGYDRGHMAPAADFKCNSRSTFYMSNVCPQNPRFNRGMWKKLERWVRKKTMDNGSAFVVTGPIFGDRPDTINGGVAIPEKFYKIIFSEWGLTAFIMPNKRLWGRLEKFVVSVDSVESVTGIDFFHEMSDSVEVEMERLSCFD